jgi:outer membrane protein OmpA-like peptidoglycan-associated protein
MKTVIAVLLQLMVPGLSAGVAAAQSQQDAPAPNPASTSIKAIGYRVGGGATKVDLKSTGLIAQANGEAKVEAKAGATYVEAEVRGLVRPTQLGTEFLTYVLWAVSPEGATSNLGEVHINDAGGGKLKASTQLQVFSLFVTAEPYFAVRQPSEMVALENEVRKDTKGEIFLVNEYKLMARGQYSQLGNPLALSPDLKHVPLEMYEARNAVDIARSRGADHYAADTFAKAVSSLKTAEDALARKAGGKEVISTARQAVQFSEDSRALSVQRQEEERITNEREAAAAAARAEAEAKAAAEAAEAKRKADEEAQRQADLAAAREAKIKAEAEAKAVAEAAEAKRRADEEAQRQAELAAAREAQMKVEAETAAAKAQAEADALKAKEEAARAEADRARSAAEALRAQLLEQFNRILETRDTPRGLVVNMADVLFASGRYNLLPATREKLARLSGIVLAHPGLNLDIEGHTDSIGSDELNQQLSERRAETVRKYLMEQGLSEDNLTARGYGKSMPVADNATAAGRQKNRRVEIIVSGEVIGARIGK